MKVLVLSCGTGEGHNSAAKAIVEALRKNSHEAVLLDPNTLRGKHTKTLVDGTYNQMIRHVPTLFGKVYHAGELYEKSPLPNPVYAFNSLPKNVRKLAEYINNQHFDAAIATHLYPMETLQAAKKHHLIHIPTYAVATDYTCQPFIGSTDPDALFIPSAYLAEEFISHGVSPERLVPSGIPVSGRYTAPLSREEARSLLDIPQNAKVMLVMAGGVGTGKLFNICRELESLQDPDLLAYVLVGRHYWIKQKIDHLISRDNVRTVLFTPKVNAYMRAADVLITKPGGLSSTEAAVAEVPLVHLLDFPGCESCNAAFFERHGLSYHAKDVTDAVTVAYQLTESPQKQEAMRKAQRQTIRKDAAAVIVHYMEEGQP